MTWYVAQIQARKWALSVAIVNLARQKHEVYVPWRAPDKPVRQRVPLSKVPLFPGYVFVQPGVDQDGEPLDWRGMKYTRGVLRLVTRLGSAEPAAVPEDVIAELKARQAAEGGLIRVRPAFATGDRVRIETGGFAARPDELPREGLFMGGDEDRVNVLLDMLGAQRIVSMPRACLAVA